MTLFHKLNLLTLNDVFKLEIAKVMHNIENNEHLPDYISTNVERVNWTHNYNTRHSNKGKYGLPKIRTETGKKSIVYWGPKIWQEVPPDFKSNLYCCIKKYDNHLIRHYINGWCLQSMDSLFSDVTEQRLLETYLSCGSHPLFRGLAHYLDCTSVIE